MAAYWRRPERYLDPEVRANISGLAFCPRTRPSPGPADLPPTSSPGVARALRPSARPRRARRRLPPRRRWQLMLAAPRLWLDPTGEGATTWIDCVPGRTDLPRTLPEMPRLGITRRPGDAATRSRVGLTRTPRPGQGHLSGDRRSDCASCSSVRSTTPTRRRRRCGTGATSSTSPHRRAASRLHDDHAVRAGAAVAALSASVRDGRRRSRGVLPSDDAAGSGTAGRPASLRGVGVASRVAHRLRHYLPEEVMSDFFDVVLRQRACRDFSDEPVTDGDIEQILEAATHAPSAENTQPWVFIVVRDDDDARRLERRDQAPVVRGRPRLRRGAQRTPSVRRSRRVGRARAGRRAGVRRRLRRHQCRCAPERPRLVDLPCRAEPAPRRERARLRVRTDDAHDLRG